VHGCDWPVTQASTGTPECSHRPVKQCHRVGHMRPHTISTMVSSPGKSRPQTAVGNPVWETLSTPLWQGGATTRGAMQKPSEQALYHHSTMIQPVLGTQTSAQPHDLLLRCHAVSIACSVGSSNQLLSNICTTGICTAKRPTQAVMCCHSMHVQLAVHPLHASQTGASSMPPPTQPTDCGRPCPDTQAGSGLAAASGHAAETQLSYYRCDHRTVQHNTCNRRPQHLVSRR